MVCKDCENRFSTSGDIRRNTPNLDVKVTGQLADRPTRPQSSRGQAYSRTSQLADSASRTQDDSHTGQLAHESARRQ